VGTPACNRTIRHQRWIARAFIESFDIWFYGFLFLFGFDLGIFSWPNIPVDQPLHQSANTVFAPRRGRAEGAEGFSQLMRLKWNRFPNFAGIRPGRRSPTRFRRWGLPQAWTSGAGICHSGLWCTPKVLASHGEITYLRRIDDLSLKRRPTECRQILEAWNEGERSRVAGPAVARSASLPSRRRQLPRFASNRGPRQHALRHAHAGDHIAGGRAPHARANKLAPAPGSPLYPGISSPARPLGHDLSDEPWRRDAVAALFHKLGMLEKYLANSILPVECAVAE